MKRLSEMIAQLNRACKTQSIVVDIINSPLLDSFHDFLDIYDDELSILKVKGDNGELDFPGETLSLLMILYSWGARNALATLKFGRIIRDEDGEPIDKSYYSIDELLNEAGILDSPDTQLELLEGELQHLLDEEKDDFDDRMKRYEMIEAGRIMVPNLPILARLDGRAFHSFTKGLKRPYDKNLSLSMVNTMCSLVERYKADLGYTQSDEITLYWSNTKDDSDFEGRYQKFTSLLAAGASVAFYKQVMELLPEKINTLPEFDCRVWQVPNLREVYNTFLWRELDATKNSVSMAAQSYFTHQELHKKKQIMLHELLFSKGINWDHYPAFFKRGTYARRIKFSKYLSDEELLQIPEQHRPPGPVVRSQVSCLDLPPISKFAPIGLEALLTCTDIRPHLA